MATYTKSCPRGAKFDWRAQFYNSDRTVYDLTDKTVKFRVGVEAGAQELEITATVAVPTSGVATGTLTGAQTATLAVGEHSFHVGVYETAGLVPLFREITGTLTITPVIGGTL